MRKHDKMKRLCMYLSTIWTIVTDRVLLQYCLNRLNRKPVFKLGLSPLSTKQKTDGPKVGSTNRFLWGFQWGRVSVTRLVTTIYIQSRDDNTVSKQSEK